MAALDERAASVLYNSSRYAATGLDLSSLAAIRNNLHPDMNLIHEHSSGPGSTGSNGSNHHRKQREFIPDAKKDDSYWDRRRRNNEAAKRSREKRRLNDMVLEQRVLELTKENHILRAQLTAIRDKYGVTGEGLISMEQVLSTLPSAEQVIIAPSSASSSVAAITNGTRQSVLVSLGRQTPSPAHSSASQYSPKEIPVSKERFREATSDALPYARNTVTPENDGVSFYEYASSSGEEEGSTAGSPGSNVADVSNGHLPHKLRHKTHLGDKDSAAAVVLLSLTDIKSENPLYDVESEPELYRGGSASSDEKDSGISSVSEWSNNTHNGQAYNKATTPPLTSSSYIARPQHQQRAEANSTADPTPAKRAKASPVANFESGALALALGAGEADSELLRSQVARLASEVETLKTFLRMQAQAAMPAHEDQ
nr:EOG090X08JU [Lepidurus arcticus]